MIGALIGLMIAQENTLLLMVGFFFAGRLIIFSNPNVSFYLILFSIFFADWFAGLKLIPPSFTWLPDIALIILTVKVLLRRIVDRNLVRTDLDIPLVMFILWGIVSVIVNGYSFLGLFVSLRQLLKFGLMYVLIINLRPDEAFFKGIIKVLIGLFAIQVPTALIKMMIYGQGEWAIGTYAVFGGGLSTILPLFVISVSLGFYFYDRPRLWYLGFLIYFQLFYFACPKRAYPMFAMVLFPFLILKTGKRVLKKLLALAPLLAVALVIILYINPDLKAFLDSPKSVVDWATSYTYQKNDEITSGRVAVAELVYQKLKEKPVRFLLGFGPGSMTEGFDERKGLLREELPIYYGWTEFTTMSLEYGFVGIGIFLWMLIMIYRKNHLYFKRMVDPYWKAMAFGYKGIWLSCLLAFFYGPVFRLDISAFLFWFLLAAITLMAQQADEEAPHAQD
jgi:hypothetical protein